MESISSVINTAMIEGSSFYSEALGQEIEESEKFAEVLKKFDAAQETDEDRRARQKAETEATAAAKEKSTKVNELRGRIAQLKSKIAGSGGDPALEAQLSALQTELFWMMFSL